MKQKPSIFRVILATLFIVFCCVHTALSQRIDYSSGFGRSSDALIILGSALVSEGNVELVGATANRPKPPNAKYVGAVFNRNPVDVTRFDTSFTFQLSPGAPGGMTFCIQADQPALNSTDVTGLGYFARNKSIAIKFDTYLNQQGSKADPSGNNTGLFVNGEIPLGGVDLNGSGIDLHSGHAFRIDIKYASTDLDVILTDLTTSVSAHQRYSIDISNIIGSIGGYVGFTGAVQGTEYQQRISNWMFETPGQIVYSVIDLGPLCYGRGINEKGQVAGGCSSKGYLWEGIEGAIPVGPLFQDGLTGTTSLNEVGQVVGYSEYRKSTGGGPSIPYDYHAFVWDRKNGIVDLGVLGSDYTSLAYGINSSGMVVGSSIFSFNPDVQRPFLWIPSTPNGTSGAKIALERPREHNNCVATGINDAGQIVGFCYDSHWGNIGLLWDKDRRLVDVPRLTGGLLSDVMRINNAGQMVGYLRGTGQSRTWRFWDPIKGATNIPTLSGAEFMSLYDVNEKGEVVGEAKFGSSSDQRRAYLWDSLNGTRDLNSLLDASGEGWRLLNASGINNRGWIVGSGMVNGTAGLRGFLLKPANVAQVITNNMQFQTSGQSVWSPGVGSFSYDLDLTKGVDTGLFGVGRYYNPSAWGVGLGDTGLRAEARAGGAAGLVFQAYANAGTVSANYPVSVRLEFPDKDTIFAGDKFTVRSYYIPDRGASVTTLSPSAGASLKTILRFNARAHVNAKGLGRDLLNITPLNVDIDKGLTLFDSKELLGDNLYTEYDIGNKRIVTGYVRLPKLNSTGSLDPGSGQLTAQSSDRFLTMRGNVTNLAALLLGVQTHVNFSQSIPNGQINGEIGILQFVYNANFELRQSVQLKLRPSIRLEFSDGRPAVEFAAGDRSPEITMPASPNDPMLTITPVFMLPNDFTSNVSLVLDRNYNFTPLQIKAGANAFSFHLGSFDSKPGEINSPQRLESFDLFRRTFHLQGFAEKRMPPFVIAGKLHAAPTLVSISPADASMFIVNSHITEIKSLEEFEKFATGVKKVILEGSNFQKTGTQAYFSYYGAKIALTTRFLNTGTLQVDLPNKVLLMPGIGRFTVTTLNSAGPSNSMDFIVGYPKPILATASPSLWASDPHFLDVLLTVVGADYINRPDYYQSPDGNPESRRWLQKFWTTVFPGEKPMPGYFPEFNFNAAAPLPTIYWNNQPLSPYPEPDPTGVNLSLLPRSFFDRSQIAQVSVSNPGPTGGGKSNSYPLLIGAPKPKLTKLEPNSVEPNSPGIRLTVRGISQFPEPSDPDDHSDVMGFVANSIVYVNKSPRPTTFISATEVQADLLASDLVAGQVNNIQVGNPYVTKDGATGTHYSSELTLAIMNPVPQLGSLQPAIAFSADPAFQGDPQFNLIVNGSSFLPSSKVRWNNEPRETRFISSERLEAALSSADVELPRNNTVTVVNTQPGGGISNVAEFIVSNAKPEIESISPDKIPSGSSALTLTVKGKGFYSGSMVKWNGEARPTRYVSGFVLEVDIPASDIASPAVATIIVSNPPPGGGESAVHTVTITRPSLAMEQDSYDFLWLLRLNLFGENFGKLAPACY